MPWLVVAVVALELGWLALWPLSGSLSHSSLFNSAVLADHPLAASVFRLSLDVARHVLPMLDDGPLAEPLGNATYVAPATGLCVVFLWLGAVYLVALRLLDRGLAARRFVLPVVIGSAMIFQLTLLFLPGLFSQDVFSYIAYGRLSVNYGLNPYVWPPSATPKDVVLPWVASVWRAYPAPYGPLWLDVQWVMARLFGNSEVADQAIAYRALAQLVLLLNLGLLWGVLRRMSGLDRAHITTAVAALAWNPLVLFEMAANAHNDALMVSFSLAAVLLFSQTRSGTLSAVGFTCGALIKYLSAIGVVWVALASATRALTLRGGALRLAAISVACVAVTLAVAWPWLELPDSLEPLVAETANVGYVNSLPDSLGMALADSVVQPATGLSPDGARAATRGIERLILLAVFGGYLLWEARRVMTAPHALVITRATARSGLVYVLLVSTSVQTWYFYMPLALALCLGWRPLLSRVAAGYSLLTLPALYLSYYLRGATPVAVFIAYGALPLLPILWARARTHEPAAVGIRDDEDSAGRHRVAGAVMEEARR